MTPAARALLILIAVATALGGAARLVSAPLARLASAWSGPGPVDVETAVEGCCAVVLAGCAVWLFVVTAATVLAALLQAVAPRTAAGRFVRGLDRLTPTVVRGLVVTVLGIAVSAGGSTAALADSSVRSPSSLSDLEGLSLPDRSVGGAAVATTPDRSASPRSVMVRAGDSLWAIAARALPASAATAATASAVRRIYATNASRIGPDPDLIQPGTALVLPDLHHPQRKDNS